MTNIPDSAATQILQYVDQLERLDRPNLDFARQQILQYSTNLLSLDSAVVDQLNNFVQRYISKGVFIPLIPEQLRAYISQLNVDDPFSFYSNLNNYLLEWVVKNTEWNVPQYRTSGGRIVGPYGGPISMDNLNKNGDGQQIMIEVRLAVRYFLEAAQSRRAVELALNPRSNFEKALYPPMQSRTNRYPPYPIPL